MFSARRPVGKYASYAQLARGEVQGRDYRVRARLRPHSSVLIVAPHGGLIEVGTSEIAHFVAGEEYNVFAFEGTKPYGENRDLHITSHQFDHPECLALAARCEVVLSVHGCLGRSQIHLGGLDDLLAQHVAQRLRRAGFPVEAQSAKYPGRHPLNICNRGSRQRGAQLEITHDLRMNAAAPIAEAVRAALRDYAGYKARDLGESADLGTS
jgi:phage replication-related protein YjqB (UPF0714/DUF867 family)